jgi:hypothetical protein
MMEIEDKHNHMRGALGLRYRIGETGTPSFGRRLGRKGLLAVARISKRDTILAWYRQLVAEKYDGSQQRRPPGRPRTSPEIEDLMVRLNRVDIGTSNYPTWVPK